LESENKGAKRFQNIDAIMLVAAGFSLRKITRPKGRAEKVSLLGGINSRPYGHQQLIDHRAGHLALPIGFFNSP
jgi:hypothetical protein